MPLPSDDGRQAPPARRGYSEEAREVAPDRATESVSESSRRGARRALSSSSDSATPRYGAPAFAASAGETVDTSLAPPKRAGGTFGATRAETPPPPTSSAPPSETPPPDHRFRGAIVRTLGSTILPGLGMLGTRLHRLGLLLLSLILVSAVVVGLIVLRNPLITAGSALQSGWMRVIAVSLIVIAAVWVLVIIGTYLISRPRRLTSGQRTAGGVVVGLLTFVVSAPLSVASSYSFETAKLSSNVFGSEVKSQSQTRPTLEKKDPWAGMERVNILLAGGDSGQGREAELGNRTDTMMMASIDPKTGATLIVQLPRNMQNPIFAPNSPLASVFPYGFTDGSDSFLSSVWEDAPAMYPDLFQETDYPGADALKWAFEGVTGQKVDYFVMVNIDGLVNLIDAMGGVTVNVNFPIAMGGSTSDGNCGEIGWIPEGPDRHLDGEEAMWYARSRCNSPGGDFGRMQRQSCLINAVIDQADPGTMLTRYEDIAQAAGDMISTDIPQEHLSAIVDLAGRVQREGIVNRISFVHGVNGYDSSYPDFDQIKADIASAIAETQEQAEAKDAPQPVNPEPAAPEASASTAEPDAVDQAEPEVAGPGEAENITDACAYYHQEPEGDWYIPDSVPRYTPPASQPAQTNR